MFESTSMSRHTLPLAVISVFVAAPAAAQSAAPAGLRAAGLFATQIETPQAQARYAAAPRREMGGGFIEFLFNGTGEPPRQRAPCRDPCADPYAGRGYESSPRSRRAARSFGYPQGMRRRARASRDGPALSAAGRLL